MPSAATTIVDAEAGTRAAVSEVIDCDVHPLFPSGADVISDWLPREWVGRLAGRMFRQGPGFFGGLKAPQEFLRRDSIPPGGGAPGTDPEFARHDLLDRLGIHRAILTPFPAPLNAWMDADEGAAVATAANGYFRDTWLAADDRYRMNMLIASGDPELAAAEIRSFGQTDGVVGVYLSPRNILMGDRFYFPIYAAAQELALPIIFHGAGADGMFQGAPMHAGGPPASYTERYILFPQQGESNIVSMIFSGVFERFPTLKVCFLEAGWAYVPDLLWRMDGAWSAQRGSLGHLKQRPSEYAREHLRFSTQPAYEAPSRKLIDQALGMMYPEQTLLFSTDYPHWDADEPGGLHRSMGHLPQPLLERIYSGNARDTFARLD